MEQASRTTLVVKEMPGGMITWLWETWAVVAVPLRCPTLVTWVNPRQERWLAALRIIKKMMMRTLAGETLMTFLTDVLHL
jgi:hypothetical protein